MRIEPGKYRFLLFTIAIIVPLDQITKIWIDKTMTLHQSIPVIPDFFSLTYIRNAGAAFGLFSGDVGDLRSAAFITISLIALSILGFFYSKTPHEDRILRLALSMVTGGAIGNLIDRIRMGEVIDFLDFYIRSYHWPAFNVADSCISIGVGLLILHSFVTPKTDPGVVSHP
jgi:signal peptidase II